MVLPPPPIQGIGNAGGFTMQSSCATAASISPSCSHHQHDSAKAQTQSSLRGVMSTFSAAAPQLRVEVDRAKADTLQVSLEDVFSTLAAYVGSSYVDQFNKFGRIFQVYVQADSAVPPATRGH